MSESKVFTEQRRTRILELIRTNTSVNVSELVSLFGVSGTTIRLDLAALEQTGEITRTHGGAILKSMITPEPPMSERTNQGEKARIASRAMAMLEEGDIVLVDTGTTMLALAQQMAVSSLQKLTVYTNDLDVLRTLEGKESWELHMLGGRLRNGFHYTYGNRLLVELAQYHFKKCFLATSALSFHTGLTTSNEELAAIKAAMIAAADQTILLMDSSKMHQLSFQRFARLDALNAMITDDGLSSEDAERLREQVRDLFIV